MSSVKNWLSGKKAYLLATAAMLTAVAGWASGELELSSALGVLWTGAFGAAIRAAIGKIGG